MVTWDSADNAKALEDAMKSARRQAKAVARVGRGLVDADELTGVGYEWIAENAERILKWNDDGKPQSVDRNVRRFMLHHVEKERLAKTGAKADDLHYYTAGEVERLLPLVFTPSERVFPGVNDDEGQPKAYKPANEGNDLAASVVDVSIAVSRLPQDARLLLQQRYDIELEWDEIGRLHGITDEAARKRAQATVQSVIDLLGGESPWRNRRPRGNAHAQAITSTTYDGSE